jgi:hypothetical protein
MTQEDSPHEIFEAIDESLRIAYEELLDEELPHRFVELIQRLKEQERSRGTNAGKPGKQP